MTALRECSVDESRSASTCECRRNRPHRASLRPQLHPSRQPLLAVVRGEQHVVAGVFYTASLLLALSQRELEVTGQ